MTVAENDSGDLDLLYSDIEDALRASVRDLLAARSAPTGVLVVYDGDRSLVPKLWQSLAVDLGLAGLLVPEDRGGAGASAREAAVVLEELGRSVAPVPFLTSSVVATVALLAAGGGSSRDALLAKLASGERTGALVVPFSADGCEIRATVRPNEDRRLEGRVTSVAGALDADLLLVPVATEAGVELHAVDVSATSAPTEEAPAGKVTSESASGVRIEPMTSLDMTRHLADVELTGAPSTMLVPADAGAAVVREAMLAGAALMASEQLGVAQWCLDTTVTHLKERRQFGRLVGGFQALKHRLADMYVMVESARAAARYAAATLAEGDADRQVAASVAQAYCSEVAVKAAEECIQLHGGIGMTWEHPAHLYLKRAKADQIGFGTPGAHRCRLGEFVDLPVS